MLKLFLGSHATHATSKFNIQTRSTDWVTVDLVEAPAPAALRERSRSRDHGDRKDCDRGLIIMLSPAGNHLNESE